MNETMNLYVMSYGDEHGVGKGLVKLVLRGHEVVEKTCFPVDGKANHAILHGEQMIIPVKEATGNVLYRYEKGQLIEKLAVRHFYSHGIVGDEGCYYLASYEDGVDAIFDPVQKKEVCIMEHHRQDCSDQAKCHYIGRTPDERYIYAVENGLQQLYVYQVKEKQFQIHDVLQFPLKENIRLMPCAPDGVHAYLNTERSNCIYTLQYQDGCFMIQDQLPLHPEVDHSFGGGLAISEDGTLLCTSMRIENKLSCFTIQADGTLTLLDAISCGNMPRDVQFCGTYIALSCTLDQVIELYTISNQHLVKVTSIPIPQPITFVQPK